MKIVGFIQIIDGRPHITYHVVPENTSKELFDNLIKASVNAFPSYEEAEQSIKQ